MLKGQMQSRAPGGPGISELPGVRPALNGGSYSQTLSRGVQVLELVAAAERPLSAGELADALDMHRSVVYRLVRTLEGHRLLATAPDGRYALGLGLLTLSRGVEQDLRALVRPTLTALSADVGATAIVGVVEGEEVVCVASVEPTDGLLRVRYREGSRHAIGSEAGGVAVLAAQQPRAGEAPEVVQARHRGYAQSTGTPDTGAMAIAAAVQPAQGAARMSVTVLLPSSIAIDVDEVSRRVIDAAAEVAALF